MPSTAVKLRPLSDRVLIRPLEEKEQKRGGIIIPDTAKEKPQEGEVISTGPGRTLEDGKLVAPSVKKGDRVLFGKYSGSEVTIAEEKYLIMREADLLATL